ncbi:hypothetical protein NDU88_004747 [Pleurodeles waltl]|uniref:Uncharacterized protein n=1 Tax=Pleurodeles waltl TaxID=8319 RepID=A0AAV7RM62_PLEWA|nr:hypothetical protein NDU88_004747 [Pleurodeles waltl]
MRRQQHSAACVLGPREHWELILTRGGVSEPTQARLHGVVYWGTLSRWGSLPGRESPTALSQRLMAVIHKLWSYRHCYWAARRRGPGGHGTQLNMALMAVAARRCHILSLMVHGNPFWRKMQPGGGTPLLGATLAPAMIPMP